MCIAVTQKFYSCKCTVTHHLICSDHVAHTHKQLDDLPCYKAQSRFVETVYGACGFTCEERNEEKWAFDHWSAKQGDFAFLEKGVDISVHHPKCVAQGIFTRLHECGIGKSVKGAWRHLNEKGQPIVKEEEKEEVDGKSKGKETEVMGESMEVASQQSVEMEVIEETKGEDFEMSQ